MWSTFRFIRNSQPTQRAPSIIESGITRAVLIKKEANNHPNMWSEMQLEVSKHDMVEQGVQGLPAHK